jgi:hypothetical protein
MWLACVGKEQWNQGVAKLLELQLGLRFKDRQLGEVDNNGWVAGIDLNCVGSSGLDASVWDADVAKQILSMLQVGFLLCATETLSASTFVLIFFIGAIFLGEQLLGRYALSYTLRLGLLGGGGIGIGLSLLLGGDSDLLALYLRILRSIPRLKDLQSKKLATWSLSSQ